MNKLSLAALLVLSVGLVNCSPKFGVGKAPDAREAQGSSIAGSSWRSGCRGGSPGWAGANIQGYEIELRFESPTRLHKLWYGYAESNCLTVVSIDEAAGGYLLGGELADAHGVYAFDSDLVFWASTPQSNAMVAYDQAMYPQQKWMVGNRTEIAAESSTEIKADGVTDQQDVYAINGGQLFFGVADGQGIGSPRPTQIDTSNPFTRE